MISLPPRPFVQRGKHGFLFPPGFISLLVFSEELSYLLVADLYLAGKMAPRRFIHPLVPPERQFRLHPRLFFQILFPRLCRQKIVAYAFRCGVLQAL